MKKLPIFLLLPLVVLQANCWHAVVGIESGAAFSSDAGESVTFPITEYGEQFYKYSRHHKSQAQVVYGGFVGAEWQGLCDWNLLLDVNYNQTTPFWVKGTLTQGLDAISADSYGYKYKIMIRQLLVEGKACYIFCERWLPFLVVGLGSSFNKAYSFSTTVPSTMTFTRSYKNHTAAAFSYGVGIGLDVDVIDYVRVGVGYRFADFGKASLGDATIDGTPVSGTLSQNHFYANELIAQLTGVF
jgi:opacity protein-like surface antigen